MLVFSSNMEGGQGGLDLWITYLRDGNWTEPLNLGAGVNSPSNEVFPTVYKEDIYFASNQPGGMGGFDYINQNGKNLYGNNGKTSNVKDDLARGRQTQKKRKIENPEYARRINQKISNTLKGHPGSFKDKQHTTETKRIIGEKSSIHQKGNKNSQFGTCWVFDEDEVNKKIKKENLDSYLSAGWIKGRRIKT
jgi:hypothetical protein